MEIITQRVQQPRIRTRYLTVDKSHQNLQLQMIYLENTNSLLKRH